MKNLHSAVHVAGFIDVDDRNSLDVVVVLVDEFQVGNLLLQLRSEWAENELDELY